MRKKYKKPNGFAAKLNQIFNQQTLKKKKMNLTNEQRLKHFQLALSMVGVTANLMTCELIRGIAQLVDEKGGAFTLDDATRLAEMIYVKYNAPVPKESHPPRSMPPEIEKMVREGKLTGAGSLSVPPAPLMEEKEPEPKIENGQEPN